MQSSVLKPAEQEIASSVPDIRAGHEPCGDITARLMSVETRVIQLIVIQTLNLHRSRCQVKFKDMVFVVVVHGVVSFGLC